MKSLVLAVVVGMIGAGCGKNIRYGDSEVFQNCTRFKAVKRVDATYYYHCNKILGHKSPHKFE